MQHHFDPTRRKRKEKNWVHLTPSPIEMIRQNESIVETEQTKQKT